MPTSPHASAFRKVVFYGDSITTGWRGTTSPRARWTSLVSDELGWGEINLAIDGMAFVRRRGPRPSLDQFPSDTGEDTALLDGNEDRVRAGIDRDFRMLHDALPGRPVVIAPYFAWSQLPPKTGQIVAWERAAAEEHGHLFTDALLTPIEADPEMLCDDGIHPNDKGHRALADSILPTLRALQLD